MNDGVPEVQAEEGTIGPLRYGEPVYRGCDNCGRAVKIVPLLSGNTLGGSLWSDGYLEAPQLPEQSLLGKCRGCGEIVCLADLPPHPAPGIKDKSEDYTFVPLALDDYEYLLANLDNVSAAYQLYIRIMFWQVSNHKRRGSGDVEPLSDSERDNLMELQKLLGNAQADRLIKVEVLRQCQAFEEAEALLADEAFDEGVMSIVERLRQLVAKRNAGLVKLFSCEAEQEIPVHFDR